MHLSTQKLLLVLAVLRGAAAYWLDPDSCASNLVVEDVIYSNVMAKTGNRHLQNILHGKGDPDVLRLASYVLGGRDAISTAADRFYRLVQSDIMTQTTQSPAVTVYCSTSHLELDTEAASTGGRGTYDPDNDIHHGTDLLAACGDGSTTRAVTHIRRRANGREISTIHLCPRYLASVVNAEVHGVGHFLTRLNDGALADEERNMDGVNFLDTTMLREFFHTAEGGHAMDVDVPNSNGWANIRRIADRGQGGQNAESLAYFAMGATLIEEQGWVVREDGMFGRQGVREESVAHGGLLDGLFAQVWSG